MSSVGCPKDVLQKANQFWSMLDDLSQDDPTAYQGFIDKHMKEGLELIAPPEVHCCLRTDILGPKRGVLYVNICSWKRVPAAQDPSRPIPLCGGRLETHTDQDGDYTVLDVAFSPSELQHAQQPRGGAGETEPQVYLLALCFAQRQHGLRLSEQYRVTSAGPKGSLDDVHQRLGFRQQPGRPATGGARRPDAVATPASLLQHIASLHTEDTDEDRCPEITIGPKPQTPRYQLVVIPATEGRSGGVVELTVELPRVVSVSECQLSVSQDDVLLEVDDLYHLLVDLPERVDEDSTSATFNKKERRLTLRADVL
ncbi:hypothetical protein NHX12_008299 [Muraenolepis orangiensis]|uniref:PIH1D1/2/3 CS-like domain-containing protein n=1 Tax=Muraenolepis orangiensis TaxID=630683 RepID=A0A9Q0DL82_9TELE|nr:hypothetical protein NHX12_008299 [Muraenolepis orangiensis]